MTGAASSGLRWTAALLTLLAILIAPTQYGVTLAERIHVSPVDPVLGVAFGLLVLDALLRRRWRELVPPPLPALCFLGAGIASLAVADARLLAIKDLVQWAAYFVAGYVLFATLARETAMRRAMVVVFLAATTGVVAVAGWQYLESGRELLAVGGTLGNRNVLGGFLCLALPVAFALAVHREPLPLRCWSGLLVVGGLAVLLSGGALLGLAAGLLIVALSRGTLPAMGLVLGLSAVLLLVYPRLPRDNALEQSTSVLLYPDGYDLSRRYPEWQAAVVLIEEQPWLGVGAGNYQRNIGMYYGSLPNPTGANEPDIQNLYLVLAASIGVPGALCFAALLAWGAAQAARRAAYGRADRALAVGCVGALAAFGIACVWHPLLVRGIGVPLVLVLAWASVPARTGDTGGAA